MFNFILTFASVAGIFYLLREWHKGEPKQTPAEKYKEWEDNQW